MSTITKGLINRGDLALYDGINSTVSRIDSTGGTITELPIGNVVDVLAVYGADNTATNRATLANAIARIGSATVTIVLSPGTWSITSNLTIPENIAVLVYPGATFSIDTGITLTINGPLLHGDHKVFEGAGSVSTVASGALSRGINVKLFGGKGDGNTTNNLTAFNNALAMSRANNTGVYAPGSPKFYRLDGTFDMDELGDRLIGDGPDESVLWFNTTNPGIKVNAMRWVIEKIGVAGKSGSGHGIHIGTGSTTAGYGTMNDVWVGWVGGHGIYLAGAISSSFMKVTVDTNNGYRPADLQNAPSLGTEQWQWYMTGANNGINHDCEFISCRSNGGGALGGIRMGDGNGKIQSVKWLAGLAQGNDDTHVYVDIGENCIIDGIHLEGAAIIPGNRWALTLDDCSTVVVKNCYGSGDVRFIGSTANSGFQDSVCCGVEIAATCGNGNFLKRLSYGGQSTGPAGGRIRDYTNVAIIEDCKSDQENEIVHGCNLDPVRQDIFSSNMSDFYITPATVACGFYTSGLTPSKETTIKLTGTNSLKCVAGAAGQYAACDIPVPEQLRGKRVSISTHVYQVTSSSLLTVRMFKNPNGQVWDDAGQVYVADDWYRVEWSAKIPDDTLVLSLQYYANAAGTFYINDLLITTDGSIDLPKGLALDTTATPELNPDSSFWQAPYLYVGAGTAITNFKRPWVGKPFTLLFTDTRTITHGATIKLNGSANFVSAAGDNLTLMYNGLDNIFYEVSRMVL